MASKISMLQLAFKNLNKNLESDFPLERALQFQARTETGEDCSPG